MVASCHFGIMLKKVQHSAGRLRPMAAAYGYAKRIACERKSRTYNCRAKAGMEASFLVAQDR